MKLTQAEKDIVKNNFLADINSQNGGLTRTYKCIEELRAEALNALNKKLNIIMEKRMRKEMKALLQKIFESGHGGGNWRRLLLQEIGRLDEPKQE